ncbi:hypothetical protein KY285_007072 [Solanum tuberosum]|nr:hypothetical protein KY289_009457 [Solanum tuberosum]KAH0745415.1 hypothetical protein KY285_007072 [Solanum tuberosum]
MERKKGGIRMGRTEVGGGWVVLSWIQVTISQEILQAIIRPNNSLTAREAWLQIECLFRDHASSRTLQLKVQFHNLKKGSLSISDYVHRLKSIADALISIGRGRGKNSNGGRHVNGGRGRGRNNNNHRNYSTAPLQFAPHPNVSSILGPAPHTSPSSFYPSYPAAPSPFQCQLCFQPTHTARDCLSLGSKALFSDLQSFSSTHSYNPVGHTP